MAVKEHIDIGERVMSFEEIFAVFGTRDSNDIPKAPRFGSRERDNTPDVYSFFENNKNMDRRSCR